MPRALRGAGLPPPLAGEGRGGGESALEVTRAADTVVPGKQYIGVTPAGPLRNSSPRPPRGRGKSGIPCLCLEDIEPASPRAGEKPRGGWGRKRAAAGAERRGLRRAGFRAGAARRMRQ